MTNKPKSVHTLRSTGRRLDVVPSAKPRTVLGLTITHDDGKTTMQTLDDGVYALDVWVAPAKDSGQQPGFAGPGQRP